MTTTVTTLDDIITLSRAARRRLTVNDLAERILQLQRDGLGDAPVVRQSGYLAGSTDSLAFIATVDVVEGQSDYVMAVDVWRNCDGARPAVLLGWV